MDELSIDESTGLWVEPGNIRGLMVTDFDRTLYNPKGFIAGPDLSALREAGSKGIVRVIATGRSAYSFWNAAGVDLPVDCVIFSSGAGTMIYPSGRVVESRNIDACQTGECYRRLVRFGIGLMIHEPVPENHRFLYTRGNRPNDDFERRIDKYKRLCSEYQGDGTDLHDAAQFLLVDPSGNGDMFSEVRDILSGDFSVIRATSPMDGVSTWIEVFRRGVTKSAAATRIHRSIGPVPTMAVGNDYNDSDLLAWADASYVMADAPAELRRIHDVVPEVEQFGFSKAFARWHNGALA